ncbi:MAG TPA: peptide chain release factor N(5)-glutamine methyltransferase [Treponemataceae bacterium]|nr:peptide chain release factor N(5)-glutamine methyltransferase [Treponemataceae bacterium]
MTIREARAKAIRQLKMVPDAVGAHVNLTATPQLDIDVILQHVTGRSRSWLLTHDSEILTQEETFWSMVKDRKKGLPVAYITNSKEFFGYDFYVSQDVLIPKADTELLVELALEDIQENLQKKAIGSEYRVKIADICTGTGCVAISILKKILENKQNSSCIDCYCTDISEKALGIARRNANNLLPMSVLKHSRFVQGNLCEPLFKDHLTTFDYIVSNPPYVPSSITDTLLEDGRNEPRLALDGDTSVFDINLKQFKTTADGSGIIQLLVPQAYELLATGGVFLIETGEYNAKKTAAQMGQAGFEDIKTFFDLSGLPRVTRGVKK